MAVRSANYGCKACRESPLKERPGFGKKLTGPIFAISPRRFSELNIVIAHDLDTIAPRVTEIEKGAIEWS